MKTNESNNPERFLDDSDNGELVRFSVSIPEELLMSFDELVARRGIAKNRSEMVRDLVRDALVEENISEFGVEVIGTLTIVYDHHATDLQDILHEIQHAHLGDVVASMHVHLDEDYCMEVIVLRGESFKVHMIADQILGAKGVKHGKLVESSTNKML